jgi:hypothetical protein
MVTPDAGLMEKTFEVTDGQGFGEVRVEAGLYRLLAVGILAVPGMGDESGRLGSRIRAEACGYFVAGDVEQAKVAEQEIEALPLGCFEALMTGVDDGDVVASTFEQGSIGSGQVDVVFEDERAQRCGWCNGGAGLGRAYVEETGRRPLWRLPATTVAALTP